MKALDTNLLVRIITRDDAGQTAAVERLLAEPGQTWFVPVTVALELEWVLRSKYKQRPAVVGEVFDRLIGNAALTMQHEDALELALDMFAEESADLADCMHVALASMAGNLPFVTLDQDAAELPGAELLQA